MQITRNTRLLVLTGAGISAESGISTFRDKGGLWENHRMEDVATPEAFARDPRMVWRFYKARYEHSLQAKPNPAHFALVDLEKQLDRNFHLITQNIDNLHTLAGNRDPIEMHGSLRRCFCTGCDAHYAMEEIDLEPEIPLCAACGAPLRPDVVWFGEMPYHLDRIDSLLKNCDVFLLVGTSGVVYPAAGFVMTAKYLGAHTLAINPDASSKTEAIDEFHLGKAGEVLPRLVREWFP
ncbi:MAG TPA: NAD-dependent deacylase [Candidatus Syntrophosphaera sp.]|jgi:NAD-dependent deacetylase|nr:NAD-dependent deacylase [Candidatus Syntrophosphaera sp.]